MKAKILVTILLISLMPIPSTTAQVPTASVSIDCLDDGLNVTSLYSINDIAEEDPRQPSNENRTLYMFWNDSSSNAWSHFQMIDALTDEEYSEEIDNGLIDIDLRFEMEPTLAQRLHMTLMACSEVRSTLTFKVIGPTITKEQLLVVRTIVKN